MFVDMDFFLFRAVFSFSHLFFSFLFFVCQNKHRCAIYIRNIFVSVHKQKMAMSNAVKVALFSKCSSLDKCVAMDGFSLSKKKILTVQGTKRGNPQKSMSFYYPFVVVLLPLGFAFLTSSYFLSLSTPRARFLFMRRTIKGEMHRQAI